MKQLIFASILTLFAFTTAFGQQKRDTSPEAFEKIKAGKISFFTEKLELTTTEAQAFWPIYNEFEKKRFDYHWKIHEIERISNEKMASMNDNEIEKTTNEYINLFENEAALLKEYNKRFLKILPKKKVLRMYQIENEYKRFLMNEYKRGSRGDSNREQRNDK